ncbi:hypothetical protein [Bradyrhizobium sp. NAS96.2]|uniref:hypothetical protein n=1 Tax=Bradyrhizobium sp. NAS96.2 TaxID=1680160 RepID=UPI001FD93891|nr:hypothetical protein [Bradyrhizobium sp. NAS96.2]
MNLVTVLLDDERAAQQLGGFVEPLEILHRKRQIIERIGIVGRNLKRLAVNRLGLFGALEFTQAGAEIVPAVGEVRLQFDGTAIGRLSLGKAFQSLQSVTAIAVSLHEMGLQRDGAFVQRERLLELALIEQGDAEIAVGAGIARIKRDGAAARRNGFVDAAGKSAHFTQIGVIERNIRIDRYRLLYVCDGIGQFAGLVRNDAEHVGSFGIVGLGFNRAARQLVCIGQKSVAALLFGDNERLAGRRCRHRRSDWLRNLRGFRRHDRRGMRGAARAFGPERREPRKVAPHDSRKFLNDARHDIGPALAALLPKQAHGRIPGIVLAIEHPAPITHPGQQHPDRLAERAGKVRNRCVNRDDEIERIDRASRIGKILKLRAEIFDRGLALSLFQIDRSRPKLQACE